MDDYKEELNDELGDALFYLTRIALDNDMHLQDIMDIQQDSYKNKVNIMDETFINSGREG